MSGDTERFWSPAASYRRDAAIPGGARTRVGRRGRTTGGAVRPEKALQREIVRALRSLGCEVMDLTQPRRTMMPLGLPDLYVRHGGWRVRLWLEVKTAKGRLSERQATWIVREWVAGGHAYIVRSVEDALHALRLAGAPIVRGGSDEPGHRP